MKEPRLGMVGYAFQARATPDTARILSRGTSTHYLSVKV